MDLTTYDLIRCPSPPCPECGGTGETYHVTRWHHTGMGGPEPVDGWDDCEECYGTGLEGCYRHKDEAIIARHRDEEDATYCARCIADMIAELERQEYEGLCTWSEALQVRETIASLQAILEAYEMEVAA